MAAKTLIWLTCIAFFGATKARAQFAPHGNSAFTSFDQQVVLEQARSFLIARGENLAGVNLTNASLNSNLAAASSADGMTIGIDFERLEAVVPPETPGAPGHAGCVVILLYHELQHLNHGWDRSYCSEIGITVHTAQQHCALICYIANEAMGPLDALCLMYRHVAEQVNKASEQAKIAAHGCSGPTTVPPCICCPL